MSPEIIGPTILGLQDVSKEFGGQTILDRVSLSIHEGDRIGIIGRNGSGKSTLMKILCGLETAATGVVTRKQGLRVALLGQQSYHGEASTVGEALDRAAAPVRILLDEYHGLMERLSKMPGGAHGDTPEARRLSELEHELAITDAWNVDQDVKKVSVALSLPDGDRALDTLSGGELRRLDIALTLIQHPDVLLMDEPTNHIDSESAMWVEDYLASYRGSCILVTHDRYFLDRVVNRIVELTLGRLIGSPGNYEQFLEYKTRLAESEAKAETSRQGILRRELAWLRRGAKARSTKQKARIKRYDELEEQGPPPLLTDVSFEIPKPCRLSKRILDADDLWLSLGGRLLFRDFSLIMQKHMRVGIVGPNGCGKTSLLRVLMGAVAPDRGKVLLGEATEFLYVDQAHETIAPNTTPLQYVSNGARDIEVNGRRVHVPAYLERFLFDRSVMYMEMQYLSGGERARLDLAKKLLAGGNFIVLDEPTNDLDLPTLRVLEEAILAFDGCALIVSHDRYFLNRVCTQIVGFEGAGEVVLVAGNYDDYQRYRDERDALRQPTVTRKPEAPAKERPPKPSVRKLTWHEKKELEGMEHAIAAAEAEVARLEAKVTDSSFYSEDHAVVQDALARFEAARHHVDGLYARWADLESIADGAAE